MKSRTQICHLHADIKMFFDEMSGKCPYIGVAMSLVYAEGLDQRHTMIGFGEHLVRVTRERS